MNSEIEIRKTLGEDEVELHHPTGLPVQSTTLPESPTDTPSDPSGVQNDPSDLKAVPTDPTNDSRDFQTWLDIFFCVFSVLLFVTDVGSDVYIAGVYVSGGWWEYFYLTAAFLVLPSLVTAIWEYFSWNATAEKKPSEFCRFSCWTLFTVLVSSLLQLPALAANLEYLWYSLAVYFGLKWNWVLKILPECENYKDRINWLVAQMTILKFIEAFIEGIPQILIQVYIVYSQLDDPNGPFGGEVKFQNILSMGSSMVTCSWSICCCYKAYLSGSPIIEKPIPGFWSIALLFFAYFLTMCARFLALSFLLILSLQGFLIGVGIHWMLMFSWSAVEDLCIRMPNRDNVLQYISSVFRSFSFVFAYVIIHEEEVPLKYWLVSLTFLIENLAIGIWWLLDIGDWLAIVLPCGLLMAGLFAMFLHELMYRKAEVDQFDSSSPRLQVYKDVAKRMGVTLQQRTPKSWNEGPTNPMNLEPLDSEFKSVDLNVIVVEKFETVIP